MSGNVESELKFVFTPEAAPRVRAALNQETDGPPERQRLVSSYFDTQDDHLWRHGATLRLRDDGQHRVQTLKRERASPLKRDEYEFDANGKSPI